MLPNLKSHLQQNFTFLHGKKLLLAVSGGLDSIVMTHLFHQLGLNIAIAHCNFQLRGTESVEDEIFVRKLATQLKIPAFITHFDTRAFAADFKLSTQMAARELRYNWFNELAETNGFDYILTAHHADDNLETFLINLSRGTGIEGLTGIPQQNAKIVRPLLEFTRDEIEQYAKLNNIEWREDSSNASDKYLRNKIRHDIVPKLKEINPDILKSIQKTQQFLQQTQEMAEDASIMVYQQVAQQANEEIHFNLKKLKQLPNYRSYLFSWLREFGFTAWDDVYDLATAQSGKQVFSNRYKLLKNREYLILSELTDFVASEFTIDENQKDVKVPLNLSIEKVDDMGHATNRTIFVDADKLQYPLQLRKWNEGDSFFPLGMEGKSKKVAKLFKDEKLSLNEKDKIWLLCSNDQIVWVIGIRADERFKVGTQTTNILQIKLT